MDESEEEEHFEVDDEEEIQPDNRMDITEHIASHLGSEAVASPMLMVTFTRGFFFECHGISAFYFKFLSCKKSPISKGLYRIVRTVIDVKTR